jgi:hypothetical protein
MTDQRTIHAAGVDALLDKLTTQLTRNAVLQTSLDLLGGRPCIHWDMLAALRLLHTPLDDVCLECNLRAPCRTMLLLMRDGA